MSEQPSDGATRCNDAAGAAIMALGKHIDARNRIDVLITAESFLMGMMMLAAPNDLRAQREYLDALTERVLGRLTEQVA